MTKRRYTRILILPGIAAAAGALWISSSAAAGRPAPAAPAARILPVAAEPVQPVESYLQRRTYTGEVRARRTSELGFERAGRLIEVAVDEGAWVEAGQPLARLDVSRLEARRSELAARRAGAAAQLAELVAGPRAEVIAAAGAELQEREQLLELARLQSERRDALFTGAAVSAEERETAALGRAAAAARRDAARRRLEELQAGTRPERIEAQRAGRLDVIDVGEVDWIEAADQYVQIHTREGAHLMRESMARLERELDPGRFLRIHRSAIVALARVRRVERSGTGGGRVLLDSGRWLPVSRSRVAELRARLR